MKIKTGVFCCILWTGILVFCSMPVFAAQSPDAERVETENSAAEAAGVEPPDVKKLEVTAFSYEDGEEEKTSCEGRNLHVSDFAWKLRLCFHSLVGMQTAI